MSSAPTRHKGKKAAMRAARSATSSRQPIGTFTNCLPAPRTGSLGGRPPARRATLRQRRRRRAAAWRRRQRREEAATSAAAAASAATAAAVAATRTPPPCQQRRTTWRWLTRAHSAARRGEGAPAGRAAAAGVRDDAPAREGRPRVALLSRAADDASAFRERRRGRARGPRGYCARSRYLGAAAAGRRRRAGDGMLDEGCLWTRCERGWRQLARAPGARHARRPPRAPEAVATRYPVQTDGLRDPGPRPRRP
jgi:hypothetical protein